MYWLKMHWEVAKSQTQTDVLIKDALRSNSKETDINDITDITFYTTYKLPLYH